MPLVIKISCVNCKHPEPEPETPLCRSIWDNYLDLLLGLWTWAWLGKKNNFCIEKARLCCTWIKFFLHIYHDILTICDINILHHIVIFISDNSYIHKNFNFKNNSPQASIENKYGGFGEQSMHTNFWLINVSFQPLGYIQNWKL